MSSSQERAIVSLLSEVALSFDGAFLGVALAFAAVRTVFKYVSNSAALCKVREAPYVTVSDLRSILESENSNESQPSNGKLVIVRGTVETEGSWNSLKTNVLVSQESGHRAVVIQRTLTCIYHEWRGFLGRTSDLRAIFLRSKRREESSSFRSVHSLPIFSNIGYLRPKKFFSDRDLIGITRHSKVDEGIDEQPQVPFVLVEGGQWPRSDSVAVNMDGSKHPLPLVTNYHKLLPVINSPHTFLQTLFGQEYPVGLLDEEKILPLGKEITAVGVCSLKNGNPEIQSCKDLPYFLSDMTKDQMVVDLTNSSSILFWGGIILGSLSVGVLGYAAVRNWNRWKEWKERERQLRRPNNSPSDELNFQVLQEEEEEETEDVPDGQLCVICLTRRRRSAFIPCGHLISCQYCAVALGREASPKCPVCRQEVRCSTRIYGS
ncbi:hypothetical protein FNV43_RR08128 [Rhamnella rubrinervis]|uniref:RING-type E3 ubiquitin transferase n=1 Tax=Rhamnella rubrinervis TaxID=2594499 RepID=A0A8K0MMZ6_9ROSA|nr:hypothetical protein FNV43_RR08128 [Rhamnella rubrinervis]